MCGTACAWVRRCVGVLVCALARLLLQSHLDRIICPRRPAASPGVWLRAGLLRRNAVIHRIVPHKPAQSRVRGRLFTERLVDSMQATRRVPIRAARVHGCVRAERRSLRVLLCPACPLALCADSVTGRPMGLRAGGLCVGGCSDSLAAPEMWPCAWACFHTQQAPAVRPAARRRTRRTSSRPGFV